MNVPDCNPSGIISTPLPAVLQMQSVLELVLFVTPQDVIKTSKPKKNNLQLPKAFPDVVFNLHLTKHFASATSISDFFSFLLEAVHFQKSI